MIISKHFTADLEQRIEAARQVADRDVKVAFHFHPMVYYQGWEKDYPVVAESLMHCFNSEEVLFISIGSITLIKPVLNKIRNLGNQTKITRMELVPDPHGKLTYPAHIKTAMFKTMNDAFLPWRDEVFFHLCMVKRLISFASKASFRKSISLAVSLTTSLHYSQIPNLRSNRKN